MPEGLTSSQIDANGLTSEEMAMEMLAKVSFAAWFCIRKQVRAFKIRIYNLETRYRRGMDRVAKVIDRITKKND